MNKVLEPFIVSECIPSTVSVKLFSIVVSILLILSVRLPATIVVRFELNV